MSTRDDYSRLHTLFSGVVLALLFAAGYVSCYVTHWKPARFFVSCLQ